MKKYALLGILLALGLPLFASTSTGGGAAGLPIQGIFEKILQIVQKALPPMSVLAIVVTGIKWMQDANQGKEMAKKVAIGIAIAGGAAGLLNFFDLGVGALVG